MFELNRDDVQLPSGLDPSTVKIRSFVVGDQMELVKVSKSGDSSQIYQKLLSSLVLEPTGLDYSDFLMSDILYVLFAIRCKSFGTDLDISMDCDECGQQSKIPLDVNTIPVRDHSEVTDGFSPNALELELSGRQFTLHLPTLKDEKSAWTLIRDMKQRNQTKDPDVDRVYMRRAMLIDQIDGLALTQMQKFEALKAMSLVDFETLKDFLRDHDTGLLLDQLEVFCPGCQYPNEVSVGLSPEFFRAPSRRPIKR